MTQITFNQTTCEVAIALQNGCTFLQTSCPQTNEPITESNYLDVAKRCISNEDWQRYIKIAGVEIGGVMCSATSADQNGITAVVSVYQLLGEDFQPMNFHFENGNTLILTRDNMKSFILGWTAFRQSFFSV